MGAEKNMLVLIKVCVNETQNMLYQRPFVGEAHYLSGKREIGLKIDCENRRLFLRVGNINFSLLVCIENQKHFLSSPNTC
jgi:hypothetical protein